MLCSSYFVFFSFCVCGSVHERFWDAVIDTALKGITSVLWCTLLFVCIDLIVGIERSLREYVVPDLFVRRLLCVRLFCRQQNVLRNSLRNLPAISKNYEFVSVSSSLNNFASTRKTQSLLLFNFQILIDFKFIQRNWMHKNPLQIYNLLWGHP